MLGCSGLQDLPIKVQERPKAFSGHVSFPCWKRSVQRRTEAEGRAGCRLGRAPSDEALLRRTAAESDVVGCGGVRFARLVPLNASTTASAVNEGVALELDCPAWRLPYYSLDLSPVLHPYTGSPVLLPPQVEYVVAYCRYPEASPPACDRVGREGKPSNAAVLRRACPRLSHGWVTQPLVRFVPSAGVYQRAKRVGTADS